MTEIVFRYVAVKPIRAEHPVGSGEVVEYLPGDLVPAEEWGRAAGNLVENGRVARLAVNVGDDEVAVWGGANDAPPAPPNRRQRKV